MSRSLRQRIEWLEGDRGNQGTPDWIFSNGVTRLALQDGGSDNELNSSACGVRMVLGSPTDPAFQKHYFDMLSKVAARIRARADLPTRHADRR